MRGTDAMQESLFTVSKLEDFVPLQVFYSLRSERMLCGQMKYNLLFRWFVGIPIDQAVCDHPAPDARLYRKSSNTAAILSYQGYVLRENRNGLVVSAVITHADGMGERAAALAIPDTVPGSQPKTLGADKAYDTADLVADCRGRNIVPYVAQNDTRRGGSAIDARTTRHDEYRLSQTIRKRIEEHLAGARRWGGFDRPSISASR